MISAPSQFRENKGVKTSSELGGVEGSCLLFAVPPVPPVFPEYHHVGSSLCWPYCLVYWVVRWIYPLWKSYQLQPSRPEPVWLHNSCTYMGQVLLRVKIISLGENEYTLFLAALGEETRRRHGGSVQFSSLLHSSGTLSWFRGSPQIQCVIRSQWLPPVSVLKAKGPPPKLTRPAWQRVSLTQTQV